MIAECFTWNTGVLQKWYNLNSKWRQQHESV